MELKTKNLELRTKEGYIAITTSIILSMIVVALAIALGSSNLLTRSDFLDFNNKQLSFTLARSCLGYALLRMAEAPTYSGNQTITVDQYQCSIAAIETSGQNKIIKASAQISGTTTNLRLTVNGGSLATVFFEELSTL